MRFLSIDSVAAGSKLGKPLYSEQGIVLLRENAELTESILCRLKTMGFTGLYIEDDISEGIIIEDIVDERLRLEAASRLENIVNNNGNIAEMAPLISDIVDNIIHNKDVEVNMKHLWGHHEYTYLHCVNVGILAVCVGIKLNFTRDELLCLGAAGILHDIGKKFIPLEILDKQGKLTDEEFDIVKNHPELGYGILASALELSSITKVGILEHHERYDGSGYPRGLRGDEITVFGRILAVADTYDAMTSDRAYRNAFSPSETVEYLMGNGNKLYDSLIIDTFIRCVTIYPVGTCVELSDGTQGIIIKNYSDCVLRPVIRNLTTKKLVDLKNDKEYYNICISKLIV
jgi:HD-GYP domain-containing protein (c-di-GMP phosphodiesterase class II)